MRGFISIQCLRFWCCIPLFDQCTLISGPFTVHLHHEKFLFPCWESTYPKNLVKNCDDSEFQECGYRKMGVLRPTVSKPKKKFLRSNRTKYQGALKMVWPDAIMKNNNLSEYQLGNIEVM